MKAQHLLIWCLLALMAAGVQAQSNQYLHFDRVDDYVRLDGGSQFIANKPAISMAGWFYTDQLAYGQGLIGFRGSGNGFYLIQLSDGILECRLETGTGLHEVVAPMFSVLPGVWQHIAWVYDGFTVTLYIDGVPKGSNPASGMLTDANIPFTIGRSILTNLNFYFGGRADEVSVWDKALTQMDIQDMMMNELTGSEQNLQLYYKFNQGQPGGNNTSISTLTSEVGSGMRDGDLIGFALNGTTSNFGGTLQAGFQAISFDNIPNKLNSDGTFKLNAAASSGLPVSFQVTSGPATVNGDSLTLNGTAGQVVVTASQPGDAMWSPAADVVKTFTVVDPQVTVPNIDLRNPLGGDVVVPSLAKIHLAAIVDTDFPELLSVTDVEFEINGDVVKAIDWGDGHYTGYWLPPAHGTYALIVRATNNYGAVAMEAASINIINNASNLQVDAFEDIWINSTVFSQDVEVEMPSFLGAYDQVMANLEVKCPPGGCGPWDRVAKVELKTHEGNWIEIMRYITPYGVACTHTLDVTDFISALQGKILFRVSCETFDNGFEYDLTLNYRAGSPNYLYSFISPVWHDTYDFGNIANLKPVPPLTVQFQPNTVASTFKLIATGHGWGMNNTFNAAEFFETTHHVWVDNSPEFSQHNWLTCNPNPDGCAPQNGTYLFDRAGFCPGAISPWFDYDMGPFISRGQVEMDYIFDQTYVDLCHPNHPNCVTGVTCADCNDGFNPHLIVASSLINFSNDIFTSVTPPREIENAFTVFPNPSSGIFEMEIKRELKHTNLRVINPFGVEMDRHMNVNFTDRQYTLDLGHLPEGMYVIILEAEEGFATEKVTIID